MNPKLTLPIGLTLVLLCASVMPGQGEPAASAPIDSTLYTTYFFDSSHTTVGWFTCGSLPGSSGCYGSGSLGPFGKVGSMMEGNPQTNLNTNTVTRAIYVLDVAAGPNHDQVVLNVYKKTDMITSDFDTVNVDLSKTITLPLTGSSSARGLMAGNKGYLLAGTTQNHGVIELDKRTSKITPFSGFPKNLSSITADQYGYVSACFDDTEFFVIGPDGSNQEGGGGAQFMLNTAQGVPAAFP